jgi:hypothetical protein
MKKYNKGEKPKQVEEPASPYSSLPGAKSIHLYKSEEMEDERRKYSASLSYAERILLLEELRKRSWQFSMHHSKVYPPALKRIITLRKTD